MKTRLPVIGFVTLVASMLTFSHEARAEDAAPERPSNTTAVVGAATLGAGYAPAFVMATGSLAHAFGHFKMFCGGSGMLSTGRCPQNDAIALYLPVIGPVIYAQPGTGDDLYRRDRGPSPTEQALLYSSAALQFGGLVTMLVGVSTTQRKQPSRASSIIASPMTTNGASGLTVASSF